VYVVCQEENNTIYGDVYGWYWEDNPSKFRTEDEFFTKNR
jgi:hypothetical protein